MTGGNSSTARTFRKGFLCLAIATLCLTGATAGETADRYVKEGAGGNGKNWDNATGDLPAAIAGATAGDTVYVASGKYRPTNGTDQTISFTLKEGVAIYGGFDPANSGSVSGDRDIDQYETILTGDIGTEGVSADNSHSVISCSGVASQDAQGRPTILDGFTITGGHAASGWPYEYGGGMLLSGDSRPTVRNCTFSGNNAVFGGGMSNHGSSPTVEDCTFSENGFGDGGGMYNKSSSPTVRGCTFSGNTGGGMYNEFSSSPTISGCTFSGNSAWGDGGGMNSYESSPTVTNCTFYNNSAGTGADGGGMYNFGNSPVITNCTFSENSAAAGSGMYNEGSGSPTVTNCIFWKDGNEEISGDSLGTFTYCVISADNPNSIGGGTFSNNTNADPILGPLADNGRPHHDSGHRRGRRSLQQRHRHRPCYRPARCAPPRQRRLRHRRLRAAGRELYDLHGLDARRRHLT